MPDARAQAVSEPIRNRYRAFAENEARGVSELYEAFALRVVESASLVEFIAELPAPKQQPNLLFAAVKYVCGTAATADQFEDWVGLHAEQIRAAMLNRSTQTNEPGRCAALLPVIGGVPGPLALFEVGASAGLCLLPDFYGYDYGRHRISPAHGRTAAAPVFPCLVDELTPLPTRAPRILWRGGLDLDPVDLAKESDARWLQALVWPGQAGRAERLAAAICVAKEFPVVVRRGDLFTDLKSMTAAAPGGATLVIFHTAVLAYVAPRQREEFAEEVLGMNAVWISNEAPGVFPKIDALVGVRNPLGRFIISVNGRPVALAGAHGQSLEWLGRP